MSNDIGKVRGLVNLPQINQTVRTSSFQVAPESKVGGGISTSYGNVDAGMVVEPFGLSDRPKQVDLGDLEMMRDYLGNCYNSFLTGLLSQALLAACCTAARCLKFSRHF